MAAMKYFFEVDKEVRGPYEVQELKQAPGFGPGSKVCPEASTNAADWKPARAYADFVHSPSPHSKSSGIFWLVLGLGCFLAIIPVDVALTMILHQQHNSLVYF